MIVGLQRMKVMVLIVVSMYSGWKIPTFGRNLLRPYSTQKITNSMYFWKVGRLFSKKTAPSAITTVWIQNLMCESVFLLYVTRNFLNNSSIFVKFVITELVDMV